MALSAPVHANLSTTSHHRQLSKLHSLGFKGKQNRLSFPIICKRRGHSLCIVQSVLDDRKSSIIDNRATEPARILLKRLFAQTQKLEEQIGRDFHLSQVAELGLNLGNLESDLQAALAALKKKEEDLQDAERKVLLEYNELNQAKQELEWREEETLAACSKQEKLEEELRQANLKLLSQAREIEDLKLLVKVKDQEIYTVQSALHLKEDEMNKMKNDLAKKIEESVSTEAELKSKAQLLNETNEIVERQEVELEQLRKAIHEKEEELEVSATLQKIQEEKLEVAKDNLEKQTMDWFLAQKELKKLAEEASKRTGEANETLEDFRRVNKLLADMRSELVSSQIALASSRQKMQGQEELLEKQLMELEEQKRSVMSYMTSLKDAQIEVESDRAKLRVAEVRNEELEHDLLIKKGLVEELHEELNKERSSLQQVIEKKTFFQEELERRSTEFEETRNLLLVKESELVEARLEVQHLKYEQASLKLILEEKDLELLNARKMLDEVNQEIAELRVLMNSREDQLIQVTTMLKEKDEQVQTMKHELNDTKLKFCEAETVVEQIVELTNKLVVSVKDDQYNPLSQFDDIDHKLLHHLPEKPADDFNWQKKQLETELEFTRESLRTKEMEVLAAQRAVAIKDVEFKTILGRLDAKERELKQMKEELIQDSDDLKKLYALAQERIGEKSIGDLAIEKLQLEAAQLEGEAATSALHKLAEMSRELLNKASLGINDDYDINIFPHETAVSVVNNDCFGEVTAEVARLSSLTDKFVKEAGIIGVM